MRSFQAQFPRAKNRTNFRVSRVLSRSSHSQIVNTLKPLARRALALMASRPRLPAILAAQKPRFEAGILPDFPPLVFGHSGWPCQKQPWTKIAHFAR